MFPPLLSLKYITWLCEWMLMFFYKVFFSAFFLFFLFFFRLVLPKHKLSLKGNIYTQLLFPSLRGSKWYKVRIFSPAWEEGHNNSGLSLMVMGWKNISGHGDRWATDELYLSETRLSGNQKLLLFLFNCFYFVCFCFRCFCFWVC